MPEEMAGKVGELGIRRRRRRRVGCSSSEGRMMRVVLGGGIGAEVGVGEVKRGNRMSTYLPTYMLLKVERRSYYLRSDRSSMSKVQQDDTLELS